ncbi:MAG: cupredoxin domain-containing protein [Acidobacteriota bacterium]|nr:cupredoxin domain-containing protein [Acidobacteriota bacterium]MDQ5871405.1 cupredoxin domain-containing protein [Acidobacteriota bacterium]
MYRQIAIALMSLVMTGSAFAEPAEPRKIEVIARKFAFEPSKIEVRVGEPVEITFRSADTKHGFACKELGLEKVVFSKAEPATVAFTAEKPGIFEFKCAKFCGLGHGKMKGEIVVSP